MSKQNIVNGTFSPLSKLRVALVHDDLVQNGGAEKVFMTIAELFPNASIYTSMATREWLSRFSGRRIVTSFMQKLPFKTKLFKFYFLLYPLAFESFDFSDYDLVISSSTRFAHGVITKPETKHVCYMHSPGRMFWEPDSYFAGNLKLAKLLSPALSYLRLWDQTTAQRVDRFIANSQNVKVKIKKYYGRDAVVVHPFADLEEFKLSSQKGNFFLVLARLTPWKRIGIAVEAAKKAGVSLKVAGGGGEENRLRRLAEGSKVEILGRVSDEYRVELYQNCKALIMTQEEDFGITSLEVQASGKPTIAYRSGGALETIKEGKTGEFFYPQTADALAAVLEGFDAKKYKPEVCRANAAKFSSEEFKKEILAKLDKVVS